MQKIERSEGDVNLSPLRQKWQEKNLDFETQNLLDEDAGVFLHQSLSSPCLNIITDCEGSHITDHQGRKYLDFHGNGLHQIGYKNPTVIQAVKDQLDSLPFSPRRFANPKATELAKKLCNLSGLGKALFTPGATSAIGIALKLARVTTGRFKTISMWDAFHGASLDAISVGGEAVFRKDIGPLLPGTEHVPPPYCYRCIFGQKPESCQLECANYIDYVLEKEGDVGAVVAETVRSTGVLVPIEGFWQKVRDICDRHGVLLILDETPTCLGRTGEMFAYQNFDITPDMVVIGKGLGGGVFPIAALIAKKELDVAGHMALGHYTHEKSPVGSAAALATLQVIEGQNLLERTRKLEKIVKTRLESLQERFGCIGEIRGIGLIWAIELVKDRETKEKADELAERILYSALDKGLSFKVSQGNVLTLMPPLILSPEQLEEALRILESCFTEEAAKIFHHQTLSRGEN